MGKKFEEEFKSVIESGIKTLKFNVENLANEMANKPIHLMEKEDLKIYAKCNCILFDFSGVRSPVSVTFSRGSGPGRGAPLRRAAKSFLFVIIFCFFPLETGEKSCAPIFYFSLKPLRRNGSTICLKISY